MKPALTFLLALLPAAVAAQQGVILYDRAVQYDFEIPEELAERLADYKDLMPSANVTSMLLLFSESI